MKMKLTGMVLAVVAAALMFTGCATSEATRVTAEHQALCDVLDTNHDQKITKEEFMAQATDKKKALEVYNSCQTGNRGYITYDELNRSRLTTPPEVYMTPPPLLAPRR
jgi:hypothetical protein